MPTIEGKQAHVWIDAYVKKGGTLSGVAKAVRTLVKKTVAGCEEYVNPWKIPTFDLNGPLCFYMVAKKHVVFGFVRGAMLRDPGKLLEGTGKYLRHVKLRSVADVRQAGVRSLLKQAADLNRKKPVTGTKVQMKKSSAGQLEKAHEREADRTGILRPRERILSSYASTGKSSITPRLPQLVSPR